MRVPQKKPPIGIRALGTFCNLVQRRLAKPHIVIRVVVRHSWRDCLTFFALSSAMSPIGVAAVTVVLLTGHDAFV